MKQEQAKMHQAKESKKNTEFWLGLGQMSPCDLIQTFWNIEPNSRTPFKVGGRMDYGTRDMQGWGAALWQITGLDMGDPQYRPQHGKNKHSRKAMQMLAWLRHLYICGLNI